MKHPLTVTWWLRPSLISTEARKKDVDKPRNGALAAIFGLGILFAVGIDCRLLSGRILQLVDTGCGWQDSDIGGWQGSRRITVVPHSRN